MTREIEIPGFGKVVLKGAFHTEEPTCTLLGDKPAMAPHHVAMLEESLGRPVNVGECILCFTDEPSGCVTGVVDVVTYRRILRAMKTESLQ